MSKYWDDRILNQICHDGNTFETDMFGAMKRTYPSYQKKGKLKLTTGTELDTNEGTDIIFDDMRLDPTLNFSNKKYMPFIYETDIQATPFHNWKIGIRIGVKYFKKHKSIYTNFPQPVVVIGLDMSASDYRVWRDAIIENMTANNNEIMYDLFTKAQDAYFDYITTDKEKRKELEDTPLKPNNSYIQNKDTNNYYKKRNNVTRPLPHIDDNGDTNDPQYD